jgi:hypothetical protein
MDYVEKFKYDGYCVIPNVIPHLGNQEYLKSVKSVIQSHTLVKDLKGRDNRLYNLSEKDSSFKSLYTNNTLVNLAKEILETDSVDYWRDRLYPTDTVGHPPLQNSSIVKSSPNRTLTCYLSLIDSKGLEVVPKSHLDVNEGYQYSIRRHHQYKNSIEGETCLHETGITNCTGQDVEQVEEVNCAAVFVHPNTIVGMHNPVGLKGTFYPWIVWEYVDTNYKNTHSADGRSHERETITL